MFRLYLRTAEIGMMGIEEPEALDRLFLISSYWLATEALFLMTRSILFCSTMMCSRRMMSTAIRCSLV